MNREQARQLLNDYLDGNLSPDEHMAVQNYLQQDSQLQRELAQLRNLLAQAAKLSVEVVPERDLWPEISDRMAAGTEDEPVTGMTTGKVPGTVVAEPDQRARWAGPSRSRFSGWWRPALAAAAVLTLVFLASRLDRIETHAPDSVAIPGWQVQDLQLAGARTMLNALELECAPPQGPAVFHLIAHEEPLALSSRGIMAHNQRIVDLAMADLCAAWVDNPHDPLLTSLLTKMYRTKADLQSRSTQLATQI